MKFDDTTHEKEQLLECIQTALTDKNYELECIIGNDKPTGRNTRVDFINVIKRIKGKVPFLKEIQQDSLVIQLPNNSEYSKDVSRIVLNGGIISQYCANESLTPIINRVKFEKKSRIKDENAKQVKIPSYGVRFNLKEEQQLASEHQTVRELVKHWSNVDKSFRRKKTFSFLHENGEFRIDLSLVSFIERREKVGYVLDNNLSRFVVKPANEREPFAKWWSNISANRSNVVVLANIDKYYKDLRSSRVMEIRDYTYEIEVEWLGNKLVHDFASQSERNEYIESTLATYTSIITLILQAMQGTFFIMSANEKTVVYNDLHKLLGDEPHRFFPQAMDLKMENIALLTEEEHHRANRINIRTDYMVTEKADGIRTLLYVSKGGQCYLITSNGRILDIGLILPDYAHSVFDGEYITKGHRGDFCQNIYLFDAYIVKHENIIKQNFIDGRYKHLFAITKYYAEASDVLIRDPKYSVRVFKKEYLSGDMLQATANQQQQQPQQFNKIFDACRQILQKVNVKYGGLLTGEGHLFTYAIDGLIFIPAKLGVAQNFPSEIVKSISGRWASNLKWKPTIHTTIDFRVRFNKEVGTNHPLIIYHDEMRFIDATLFIKLYINDNEMRRYMALKLLNEGDTPDYYPEDYPFNPVYPTLVDRVADGTPVNMASVIRLPIDKTNTTKCENGDIIEDGMIIECRYERDSHIGFQWIPTRVRSDKTAPNAANTVLTTWGLINDPITLDMITTDGLTKDDYSIDIGYFYYKGALMNDGDFDSKPMNHFNNFVKSIILERGLKHKQKARVLDLGCGKLGDLIKYARLHVDTLVGIDVSPFLF